MGSTTAQSTTTPDLKQAPELIKFDFKVPREYKTAMKPAQANHWKQACVKALHDNGTWKLVIPSPGTLIIQNKWVLAIKTREERLQAGEVPRVQRSKARLVAHRDSNKRSEF